MTADNSSGGVQVMKSFGESQCEFCYSNVPEGEGLILHNCLHTFCKNCLVSVIEGSDAAQIKCPIESESHCGGCLLDPEIKYLVSPQTYEKYISRSIQLAMKEDDKLFKCQTVNCTGLAALDKGVNNFQCEVCLQNNCVKCKGLHSPKIPCPSRTKRKLEAAAAEASAAKKLDAERKADSELKKDWDERWEQITTMVQKSNETNNGLDDNVVVDMFQGDLIKSTVTFECPICFDDVPENEGIILQECFHSFCRICLQSTIRLCEEPEVKCLFQGNHASCNATIQEREIKALVSKEVYEKHLSLSISKAELSTKNAFHCKSVNCSGWCEAEEGAKEFQCPICRKKNCVECQTIHEAVTCKEYQYKLKHEANDDASKKALDKLISSRKAMRCPTCKVILIKSGGCDGIDCRICRTMLCWATRGPRWGPKGPGDTSGGCKCGLNGKMCHKSCRGCH